MTLGVTRALRKRDRALRRVISKNTTREAQTPT